MYMVIDRMREISLGRLVYTSDGDKLGRVKNLRLDGFKVSFFGHREYWLPMKCVESAGDKGLQLSIEKGDLDRFKTSTPRLLTHLPRPASEVPRPKQRRAWREVPDQRQTIGESPRG
jgi:hypothetical protein